MAGGCARAASVLSRLASGSAAVSGVAGGREHARRNQLIRRSARAPAVCIGGLSGRPNQVFRGERTLKVKKRLFFFVLTEILSLSLSAHVGFSSHHACL